MTMSEFKRASIGRGLLILAMGLSATMAFAQVDLAGNWAVREGQDFQERGPGPDPVDYTGLPINEEGRAKALSYTASILSMRERQCLYYIPPYLVIGPFPIKMWEESDPDTGRAVAWKIGGIIDRDVLTIYMDGRPHPPDYAPHTFAGFTTGEWDGDTLNTYTTHFKAGYLRRNGVPTSDKATMTAHFMRHGDFLTVSVEIEDPVYLTEPDVVTHVYVLDAKTDIRPTPAPCTPAAEVPRLHGDGLVPHLFPGKNPAIDEFATRYNLPRETALGGAETMYPEYRKKLQANYKPPEKCVRYCCGWEGQGAQNTLTNCINRGAPANAEQEKGRF